MCLKFPATPVVLLGTRRLDFPLGVRYIDRENPTDERKPSVVGFGSYGWSYREIDIAAEVWQAIVAVVLPGAETLRSRLRGARSRTSEGQC